MAGYKDTRQLIIDTLMNRPAGTEIQPENHQEFALAITDYVRSVELLAGNAFIGFAEANTVPVQSDKGQCFYISTVRPGQTVNFVNFIDSNGNAISVSSPDGKMSLVTLIWNTQYWSSQIVTMDTNWSIAQQSGSSESMVMSQKAITDAIAVEETRAKEAEKNLDNKVTDLETGMIYDVSANNNDAVFESLQALLSSSDLNTLIPPSVRHGGMSIKFIQGSVPSSDNKYVQYRLISQSWNTTITNWLKIDSGGNIILEWNTDRATTRKEVINRKEGLQISYKDPNSGWINEQYIGTLFTDTEWVKDSNWERILNFDVIPNEDYPTQLSNGEFFDGYGLFSLSTSSHRLTANSILGVIAYPLEADTTYTIDNMSFETSYLNNMAFAIKDGSSGTGVDFRLLLPTEITYKAPILGLGEFNLNETTGEILTNKEKYIINPLVVTSELIGQLYLIIGYRYGTSYNKVKVYKGVLSDVSFKNSFIPKNGILENYEYIKEKACKLNTETTKNIFSKNNISLRYGVIYNAGGRLSANPLYQCTYIPLKFDTYYTVSGYKWIPLGGTSGANNVCLACKKDEVVVNLKVLDFKAESTWLNTDTFFKKTDNIYKDSISQEVFTFKTPQATDLNVDNIGIVINTLFGNKPIEFVDGLQVEVGTSPTDYVEGGGIILEKVFGYPLPKMSSGGSRTSGDAVLNYLKNQVMFFFGDSITQGTDGGYVDLVKDKIGLGNAVNYGSSGATTGRLVDIMTGLGIREPGSVRNVDYMTCKAITIQIGTNGGVSGNFEKDIPNISIYDIQSYPYTYNNSDGTITNATLDNAEDYFKKLFPNTFYGNLALCLEWVRWKNPNCRVYLITIPPSNRNNHIAVRDALIKLGNLYSIHVIDAQANSGCSIRNITEWSLDKTHLNIIGNELWASYIARELVTNYYNTEIES